MENKKNRRPIPGEIAFLTNIKIPQGLLFILVVALFVFITQNQYYRLLLYAIVIYYLFIWTIVTVRDLIDKNKKPPENLY